MNSIHLKDYWEVTVKNSQKYLEMLPLEFCYSDSDESLF